MPRSFTSVPRERDAQGRPANARPRDRYGRPLPRGAEDQMPSKAEPDEVVSSMAEAFEHAVGLFDRQRFFEAHEFLEWIWKHPDVDAADKDFWKGVTQVAVGCCHTQRENEPGALTLLERAADYLEPYPDVHHGVDTAELRRRSRALAAQVREHGAAPDRDFPSFPTA
jgi:predicted metal-dependent hydrolase